MKAYPEVLNRLIHDELPGKSTYDEFSSVVNELKNEIDRMEQHLPGILSTKISHEELERFIQSVQCQLLCWMEKVYAYLPEQERRRLKKSSEEWSDGFKEVYNSLEELLQFILRNFKRYTDIMCRVPASRVIEAQDKVGESLVLIQQRLGKSDIDQRCKEIIMKPFNNLIAMDAAAHTVTYVEMHYLEELHSGLTDLFVEHSDDNLSQKLHELLIYLNFNDPHYYMFVMEGMKRDIEEQATSIHQLVRYYELENENDQLLVKPELSYIPNEGCLKEQLRKWITKRIAFIKLSMEILQAPMLPADLAKFLAYKIFVNLSMDQVSYMINVLYDKGIIKNNVTKKSIMEFVTYFITTKNSETPSVNSAINKMYNPGATLVESVRSLAKDFLVAIQFA